MDSNSDQEELLLDMVWDEALLEQIPDAMVETLIAYIQNGLAKVDAPAFQHKIQSLQSKRLRKIAMTLTEKYIEDGRMEGRNEGILIGEIRGFEKSLGRQESSTSELLALPYQALQTLHQRLETEIRQRLRS